MSELKVNSIKGTGASTAAITINSSSGGATANITNLSAGRNVIINGACILAQRTTSKSGITSSGVCQTVDRWNLTKSTGSGTTTMSQSTDAPTQHGFGFSTKYEITTAATDLSGGNYFIHSQRLMGEDLQRFCKGTSGAKKFTLSFYVKTNKTGTYNVELQDNDNTRHCVQTYTVSDTNWNRYTLSFPADTTGAFDNDVNNSLVVNFWLAADLSGFGQGTRATTWATFAQQNRAVGNVNIADSTSNEWLCTGVQLEVDSTGDGIATDFEHVTKSQELMVCQRYYYPWMPAGQNSANIGIGCYTGGGNQYELSIRHPVRMRATPTYEEVGGTNYFANFGNTGGNSVVTYNGFSADQVRDISGGLFTTSAGSHGGKATRARFNNANTSMAFNAEL